MTNCRTLLLTSWYFTLIKHDILVTLPRETGVDKWGPEEGAATTTLGGITIVPG